NELLARRNIWDAFCRKAQTRCFQNVNCDSLCCPPTPVLGNLPSPESAEWALASWWPLPEVLACSMESQVISQSYVKAPHIFGEIPCIHIFFAQQGSTLLEPTYILGLRI
ncbi:mCG1027644, partial [Mus musculus]